MTRPIASPGSQHRSRSSSIAGACRTSTPASEDDVFLAQGWNAARDRLWQLDLWKRRGDGTLSEAFGPEYVAKDRAARLLLYRGDLRDEWIAYAGDTKRIVSSFVAGINAYVALTEQRPDLLPPEFRALDYRPARWTPETVVEIRSHGLLRNAKAELKRALFLRRFGARALALRDHYEPAHELEVPEALDLTVFDEHTLADYDLGTGAVSFAALLDEAPAPGESAASAGSNNWAIAASRTTTGRPILANDPHRALELPSLRYLVHLSSPRLALIGAGEPALPGVSLGHNGHVAFGFTIFGMDQEDVYVLSTRQRAGETPEYRVGDGWERMTEVREHIAVRDDAAGRDVVLRFTRYGPVLAEDPARGVAIALRAAWLEPGMAPYLASLELQRVRDWDGFLAALNRWGLPGENLVYADTSGAIGWKPAGRIPVRQGWDGLLPVPGGGRYEWDGYLDGDALPVESNPTRGWVASANQMNLPPGYPHAVGYEWAPSYRYERIAEALSARERWSIEDAARLQTDYVSMPARRLVERLRTIGGPLRPDRGWASRSDVERRALALLRDWDCRLDARSPAAALFEVWLRRHLPAAVWGRVARAQGLDAEAAHELESTTVPALLTVIESRHVAVGRGNCRAPRVARRRRGRRRRATGDRLARLALGRASSHPLRPSAGGAAARQARHRDRDRTGATLRKRRHAGRHHLRASRLPAAVRRERPRRHRRRRLGQLGGDEHSRSIGRARLGPLPGPLRQVGRRRDLPAALEPRSHRGRDHAADPSRSRSRRLNRPLSNFLSSAILTALRWQRRPETKSGNEAGTVVAHLRAPGRGAVGCWVVGAGGERPRARDRAGTDRR